MVGRLAGVVGVRVSGDGDAAVRKEYGGRVIAARMVGVRVGSDRREAFGYRIEDLSLEDSQEAA